MIPLPPTFLSKVEITPTCWLWTASKTSHGYGVWWDGTRTRMAHRAAYEILVGPISGGLPLDHLCRVRHCVRPDHLEPVTHQVNILRGVGATARNARKSRCPQGHLYAGDNVYIDSGGRRRCATCRPAPTVPHPRDRTHCIHGHAFTESNTYVVRGRRQCRRCKAERKRRTRVGI